MLTSGCAEYRNEESGYDVCRGREGATVLGLTEMLASRG